MSPPWLKFYPADWRADQALRVCSLGARGLWIELMCVMHESEPYGHLLINGRPVTVAAIGALTGASQDQVGELLGELEAAGVFSRNRAGVIYSRRMTRDEKKARIARVNGKGGGNPRLCKQTEKDESVNPRVNPEDKGGLKPQKPERDSELTYDPPSLESPPSATETTSPSQTPPCGGNGHTKPKSVDRGTRMPEDWRPSEDAIRYCREELAANTEILNREYAAFVDWGLSATGPASRKRDWDRAFINWIRRVMNEIREQEARERRWAERRQAH